MATTNKPIIIISLITAACLLGDSMLYVVLPTHWSEAGLTSLWQVGVILAINRLARLPLNHLVGWIYQRISARNGISFAVILSFITTAGYGLTTDFLILLLLRCLWGLAWTFLRLGAYFTIMDNCPNGTLGKAMGQYNGLYRLGSLAGMLTGGIIADFYGLQFTAILFGILSLTALPFVFIYFKSSEHTMSNTAATTETSFSLRKNYSLLAILSTGMFTALIYQGVFAATLSYIIEVHNSSTVAIGSYLVGAASLGGIIQAIRWSWEPFLAPLFGKLSDGPKGRYPILITASLAGGISFALLAVDMPLLIWLGLLFIIQLTATVLTTVTDALAADAAMHSAKVKIMTLYSLLIDLGAAAGPIVAYLLNQYLHPFAACWVVAAIMLAIALQYTIKLRQQNTPQA